MTLGLGLIGTRAVAAEPPPETTRLRLGKVPSICLAPQYVAEDLLRAEGFSQIQYVGEGLSAAGLSGAQAMGAGQFDISMNFAAPLVIALDQGAPIVLLGGVHVGCFELYATERVRTIKDLKGKTVAILSKGSAQHVFLASIATSVGLDPNRDINWVDHSPTESKRLLAEGKIDAYLGFPPDPQELRATKVGRLLLNSAVDRPWSQYFCCLVAANKEFARKHPVAAKRAMRAILKASELCASDPDLAAKAYLAQGYKTNPDHARQAIRELPYGKWRDYNPEETVRFYALRLREADMVKASPQKLIAQGTDWRILEQLKREMKT
ncbi:MAG TPA: ABC transporter substrate-binding protein [Casimicrobiaceae bacterium]|nr:ABC transporter substrate-binding protein [Casimicrobiaceae bacterium]